MRRVLAVLSLLALIPAAYAAGDKRVQRTVPLDPDGRVTIKTHNGVVNVSTWNRPNVQIDALIEPGEMGYAEDVDKTDVTINGTAKSVDIESDYSRVESHLTWFGITKSLPIIRYTISVPATALLSIDVHNAEVRVTGLRNDLRVRTHNGRVVAGDLEGAADVETHNGSVSVAFSRFAKASRFETHNGDFDIKLPSDARVSVDARGHHMDVSSDFPVATTHMRESSYVGTVNGGGPELRFVTHNGSLRLRKS